MSKIYKKRSLRRRMIKMISILNLCSMLIMLIAMMTTFGMAFKYVSKVVSNNVAQQMNLQLEYEWTRSMNAGILPREFTRVTPAYMRMFKKIGNAYKFFDGSTENLNMNVIINHVDDIKQAKNVYEGGNGNPQLPSETTSEDRLTEQKKPAVRPMPDFLTIEYRIWKDDKLIYASMPSGDWNNAAHKPGQDDWIMTKFNTRTTVDVKDDNGRVLAKLEVKLNPQIIYGGYLFLITISVIIFLITLALSHISVKALSRVIISPLTELDKKMNEILGGNIEAAMETEIVLKRPAKEVQSLVDTTNKIMSKMHEYVDTLESQKLELEAQNTTLQESSCTLESVNQTLANRILMLKNVFNNVEQGFFIFKRDLLIFSEYSFECRKTFGQCISGKKLSSILYPDSPGNREFVDELLLKIFDSNNAKRKLYLPLLPEEVTICDRVISAVYKVVKDEKNEDMIMVITTDITEKRLLEKQMDEERKILRMVVKAIINRDDFKELVKEYEEFAQQPFKYSPDSEYERILRQIHTFKGNFSQYDMLNLVPQLNELENKLYEKKEDFSVKDVDGSELHSWLRQDINIIESYAGKDFMNEGELCYIKKEKLMEIEKKIQETLSPNECRAILPLIKSLRYKSVKDLLKTYPDYVMKMGERLEKSVRPFEVTGDEVLVDTGYYQNAFKSLVHIFRNCIDHGIETEDQRLEMEKEQLGSVTCQVRDLNQKFQIIISDDGRGIDVEALEERVINEGLYTKEELSKMSLKQKFELIFEHGISTKEQATCISGRGVGMAAVKQCISEHGGKIEVDSTRGKGTAFTITLPKVEGVEEERVTTENFMREMARTAKDIVARKTGMDFLAKAIEAENSIALNEITALLSLKGTLNSIIMISVNKLMAKKLVQGLVLYKIEEDEIQDYLEDALGEMTNTILGNTLGSFENTKSMFCIGLPAVLCNSGGYVKYTQSKILTCKLVNEQYEFSLNMLTVEDENSINEIEGELLNG